MKACVGANAVGGGAQEIEAPNTSVCRGAKKAEEKDLVNLSSDPF